MDQPSAVVSVENVSKRFGAQWALEDVSLSVRPGEIHGLLGQNGSGKSTLIKILAGFHTPDAGRLVVEGRQISLPVTGRDRREHRLRFVHQDLALVPSLSVADNFTLDQLAIDRALRPAAAGAAHGRRQVEAVLQEWGVDVPATAIVDTLTRLDRAKIAIVKAVRDFGEHGSRGLLVLDEPTAFLPPDEAATLFATMRRVADAGAGVLFVSHNLDEIMNHTDRATVLRDGRVAGSVVIGDSSVDDIVELILGRPARATSAARRRPAAPSGAAVDLVGVGAPGLRPFDLTIAPGDVVGLTGLIGSGFEKVASSLFGIEPGRRGTIAFGDERIELDQLTPATAVGHGIGYVPSERLVDATAPSLTVDENVGILSQSAVAGLFGRLTRGRSLRHSRALLRPVDVRPDDPTLPLLALSGGNQQKVVIAKWLSIAPRLLIFSEPTQGVDVGAREQIAGLLRDLADRGCAVICASSDLDQLTELCTRVLVFRTGEVVAELQGPQVTKHELMLALFAQKEATR